MKILLSLPINCSLLIPADQVNFLAIQTVVVVEESGYPSVSKVSKEPMEIRLVSDDFLDDKTELAELRRTNVRLREDIDKLRQQPQLVRPKAVPSDEAAQL
jgi:cell division protein FtsB